MTLPDTRKKKYLVAHFRNVTQEEWCIPNSSFGLAIHDCRMLYFDRVFFFFEVYFVTNAEP